MESKGQLPNEAERRRRVLETLRDEYVMSHQDAPVSMITGNQYPSADWMNKRLRQLGENWSFNEPQRPPRVFGPPVLPPIQSSAKANIVFSFDTNSPEEFPILETSAQMDGAAVHVKFTYMTMNDVEPKNGLIIMRVCNRCIFASEPERFTLPSKELLQSDRTRPFAQLYPGVAEVPTEVAIIPPLTPGIRRIALAFFYTCENCPQIDYSKPQQLWITIVRPPL